MKPEEKDETKRPRPSSDPNRAAFVLAQRLFGKSGTTPPEHQTPRATETAKPALPAQPDNSAAE